MTEISLVERIRRHAPRGRGSGIVLGIGDDCAVMRPRRGEDLVFTTDLMVEDVHFRATTHPAHAVGHKALARGLSDIAAMGAEPRFALLSMALGPWTTDRWIQNFFRGFRRLARSTGVSLAGGDLARSGRFVCDIVVCGAVPRGTALRRDGARPGDLIYVSGTLGGSALGLAKGRGKAWQRHLKPEPRLALGKFLRTRLPATAAMDLSDGVSLDLFRLTTASGVAAVLDAPLPVFRGATPDQAFHGGEDYELLFTVRPSARVPRAFRGLPLTRIGRIREGRPGLIEFAGGRLRPLGWDHFRPPS